MEVTGKLDTSVPGSRKWGRRFPAGKEERRFLQREVEHVGA